MTDQSPTLPASIVEADSAPMDADQFVERARGIEAEVGRVIVGQADLVRQTLTCLLAGGHALLEGVPGLGKTLLVRTIADVVACSFNRIQFTPDLMPADITGTNILVEEAGSRVFRFQQGPIFANLVLADEINRATPKTQSSLLEGMEEFQVTVDGATRPLEHPFIVIATENPIEYRGTYPLPEAQLDRFLMRISLGYPTPEQEVVVLERQVKQHPIHSVKPVVGKDEVLQMQENVREVHIESSLKQYMVEIVAATRDHPLLALGASPRASLGLMRTGQARAALSGRDYVLPDDVKTLAAPVLCHRLILKPEARLRQSDLVSLVHEILDQVPVPAV